MVFGALGTYPGNFHTSAETSEAVSEKFNGRDYTKKCYWSGFELIFILTAGKGEKVVRIIH